MECVRHKKENCRGCMLSYEPKLYDGGCRVQSLSHGDRQELSRLSFFEYMVKRYGDSSGAEGELTSELQRLAAEGYPVQDIDSFTDLITVGMEWAVSDRANEAVKESLWVEYSYITGKPLRWIGEEVDPEA